MESLTENGDGNILADIIRKNNQNNKNVNVLWIGLPGSGKSLGAISLLMDVLGIYTPKILDYVHFNAEEYTRILEQPCESWETHLLDDAGYTAAARDWHTKENIKIIKEIQVARKEKKNLFLSTPHPRLIDSGFGTICHLMISLDYWQARGTGTGELRRHEYDVNEYGAKDVWRWIGKLRHKRLSTNIIEAYEDKKRRELREKADEEVDTDRQGLQSQLIVRVYGPEYIEGNIEAKEIGRQIGLKERQVRALLAKYNFHRYDKTKLQIAMATNI